MAATIRSYAMQINIFYWEEFCVFKQLQIINILQIIYLTIIFLTFWKFCNDILNIDGDT